MAVEQNLYPPIVPDTMPAFVDFTNGVFKIYFSLSIYNNINNIKNVQISLINQKTNKTIINNSFGIVIIDNDSNDDNVQNKKFVKRTIINNEMNDYDYQIHIQSSYITGFETNQFYIAQLRFTSVQADNIPIGGLTAQWLSNNLQYFSEWSTPCLIKKITQPVVQIYHFDNQSSNPTQFFEYPAAIVGRVIFGENENEYLKSYRITIIQEVTQNNFRVLLQTDQIQTNSFNPNEFRYELKQDLPQNQLYTLSFSYTTNNLYKGNVTYQFQINEQSSDGVEFIYHINAIPQENNGRIKIHIVLNDADDNDIPTSKRFYIKRTSSKTNFKTWEILKIIYHNQQYSELESESEEQPPPKDEQHTWYDTSVESGVWYKYRVQKINEAGTGNYATTQQPVMCLFEDIFLTDGYKQLKIQFNPTISDFKYNVTESQQITLGSKFPFIKRNGNNFFRSFSIGGLISAFMDFSDWYTPNYHDGRFFFNNQMETFTSPIEIYDNSKNLYDKYNEENNIDIYKDYVYEKEFRQKVSDFLYDNKVKLFKSLTEGNILIKLINISFQPINELGRMLYSFSATAIEIDENNLDNYKNYNIFNKYYYCYRYDEINGENLNQEKSIIKNFLDNTNDLEVKNLFDSVDIMALKINNISYFLNDNDPAITNPEGLVIYTKILNNKQFIRYTINNNNQFLFNFSSENNNIVNYLDEDPIQNCYFIGIHLNDYNDPQIYLDYNQNQGVFSSSNGDNFSSFNENTIYYISSESSYHIDNYEFFSNSGILTTYQHEVVIQSQNVQLLVQKTYNKYLYYNGQLFLFTDYNDILINKVNANIGYYYRIQKMS